MGEMDPKGRRENQVKGSGACRALQGNWGLQEVLEALEVQDQKAKRGTMETIEPLRRSWQIWRQR